MDFVTHSMGQQDVRDVTGWTYEPPYNFYDMGADEESINELMNGTYSVVHSIDGYIVGFYCVGESAQVPAGHKHGAYLDDGTNVVDLGIGMRPDLTGCGMGTAFLAYVLRDVGARYPLTDIRLAVATFNQRAIKLYRRFGFYYQFEFDQEGVAFQTMRKSEHCKVWLRRALPNDEDYVQEWLRDPTDCTFTIGHSVCQHEDYVSWMEASDQQMWVLDSESGPMGYGEVWTDEVAGDAELAHLIVASDMRGQGLGRTFVELLYHTASNAGYPWIYMRVHPDNGRALACYRAAGFQMMEHIPADWPAEYVWMRRATPGHS